MTKTEARRAIVSDASKLSPVVAASNDFSVPDAIPFILHFQLSSFTADKAIGFKWSIRGRTYKFNLYRYKIDWTKFRFDDKGHLMVPYMFPGNRRKAMRSLYTRDDMNVLAAAGYREMVMLSVNYSADKTFQIGSWLTHDHTKTFDFIMNSVGILMNASRITDIFKKKDEIANTLYGWEYRVLTPKIVTDGFQMSMPARLPDKGRMVHDYIEKVEVLYGRKLPNWSVQRGDPIEVKRGSWNVGMCSSMFDNRFGTPPSDTIIWVRDDTRLTVIHELAHAFHALLDPEYHYHEGHGSEFITTYMEMLVALAGVDPEWLHESLTEHELPVADLEDWIID